MEQIRSSGLEEQLAYHTAPVLMGIKPAGLFSVGQALGDTWKQIRAFHQKMAFSGLRIRILCSCKKRLLLFVYQEQRLEAALSPSIRTLLRKKFGYRQTQSLDAMLSELAEHIQQSATFPHENWIVSRLSGCRCAGIYCTSWGRLLAAGLLESVSKRRTGKTAVLTV